MILDKKAAEQEAKHLFTSHEAYKERLLQIEDEIATLQSASNIKSIRYDQMSKGGQAKTHIERIQLMEELRCEHILLRSKVNRFELGITLLSKEQARVLDACWIVYPFKNNEVVALELNLSIATLYRIKSEAIEKLSRFV